MDLKPIEVREVIKGTKSVPKGPFKLESYDTRSEYYFDRVVLVDRDGRRLVIKGNSALEFHEEIKPEPVKKFVVSARFKETDVTTVKKFMDRSEADKFADELGDDWKTDVQETEELPEPADGQSPSSTDEIPF